MAGRRKDGHVGADLSDHDLGSPLGDTGDSGRQLDAGGHLRVQVLGDRFGEPVDLLVKEVQVGEDRANHDGMVGFEAAFQRFA